MLYKDITKYIHNYFWRVFHSNGWTHIFRSDFDRDKMEEQESLYQITLLEEYECTVTAHVITDSHQLGIDEYGVMWINVKYEYNDDDGHSWNELEEMQAAIIDAEDNLLAVGIPFNTHYEFHGKNKANKTRKNDALCRKLDLAAKSEKDWEDYRAAKAKYKAEREKRKAEKEVKNERNN